MGGDQVTRPRRGGAKENPAALRRAQWHDHVARTPAGMVPQILNGTLFVYVYGFAMGPDWTTPKLREYFTTIAPSRHWPSWMRREATETPPR